MNRPKETKHKICKLWIFTVYNITVISSNNWKNDIVFWNMTGLCTYIILNITLSEICRQYCVRQRHIFSGIWLCVPTERKCHVLSGTLVSLLKIFANGQTILHWMHYSIYSLFNIKPWLRCVSEMLTMWLLIRCEDKLTAKWQMASSHSSLVGRRNS